MAFSRRSPLRETLLGFGSWQTMPLGMVMNRSGTSMSALQNAFLTSACLTDQWSMAASVSSEQKIDRLEVGVKV